MLALTAGDPNGDTSDPVFVRVGKKMRGNPRAAGGVRSDANPQGNIGIGLKKVGPSRWIFADLYGINIPYHDVLHGSPAGGKEKTLQDMNANMVLLGFLVMLICQDIVALRAFKNQKMREGILSAIIPGYLLIYGSREDSRHVKPIVGWFVGLGILLMGFVR